MSSPHVSRATVRRIRQALGLPPTRRRRHPTARQRRVPEAAMGVEEQLAGPQAPTHVGRVLQDLCIGYIRAHCPQAKGRIERLWGTLQDRLVSELRLLGVVRRYLHRLDLMTRRRRAVASVPSDCGGARLALLVVALFYAGGSRAITSTGSPIPWMASGSDRRDQDRPGVEVAKTFAR